MSIFQTSFYQKQTKKIIATFGSIFNDLEIVRENKSWRVPINYGTRSHWIHRIEKGVLTPDGQVQIQTVVPRLSYELKGATRDMTRAENRLNRVQKDVYLDASELPVRKMSLSPVPWNFEFSLAIYATHMDDLLAIIEQITAYFNPSVIVGIRQSESLDIDTDVSIDLQPSWTIDDSSEQGFETSRVINAELTFVVKSFIYGPVKEQRVILKSIVESVNFDTGALIQTITAEPIPGLPYDKNRSTVVIEE